MAAASALGPGCGWSGSAGTASAAAATGAAPAAGSAGRNAGCAGGSSLHTPVHSSWGGGRRGCLQAGRDGGTDRPCWEGFRIRLNSPKPLEARSTPRPACPRLTNPAPKHPAAAPQSQTNSPSPVKSCCPMKHLGGHVSVLLNQVPQDPFEVAAKVHGGVQEFNDLLLGPQKASNECRRRVAAPSRLLILIPLLVVARSLG